MLHACTCVDLSVLLLVPDPSTSLLGEVGLEFPGEVSVSGLSFTFNEEGTALTTNRVL